MIICNSVCKTYYSGRNSVKALSDISIKINDGEMVAVVGPSGAGKSTLLHILACVQPFDSGEYIIDNISVGELSDKKMTDIRRQKIGVVFQNFLLLQENTVIENTSIPLLFLNKKKKDRQSLYKEALEKVELTSDLYNRNVKDLSGGQKQRVAIARAIVNHPNILLADEPTGALDSRMGNEIVKCFKNICEDGSSVVLVTHDMNIAKKCDRIIKISDGKII